jgi:diguanylate cyclase
MNRRSDLARQRTLSRRALRATNAVAEEDRMRSDTPSTGSALPAAESTPLSAAQPTAQEWAHCVARVLKALDSHHAGVPSVRKREGLARALAVRDADATVLLARLGRLVDSWSIGGTQTVPMDPDLLHEPGKASTHAPTSTSLLRATTPMVVAAPRTTLGEDQFLAPRLRELLTLLLTNVAELTPEHQQLGEQVEQLNTLLALPLSAARLAEAERQLRAIIIRQGAIRHRLEQSKQALKDMMTTLIARLSAISDTTGSYYEKVETYSQRIGSARDIGELSDVVRNLLDDTRVVTADMARARDDLVQARQKVRDHEQRVEALESELARITQLVRTDPLTQTLNRRGFEETYALELSRCERLGLALTVALLDVDDFKRLNDTYGHHAGDLALKHLADVLRASLRPSDAVGRYGGEEFVILLPETEPGVAVEIMARVQRELTKRIFMHDLNKVLITFSAGVADLDFGKGFIDALERCDKAMYAAKQSGKNRVELAPSH